MANAFQHNAFQQTIGFVAFQGFFVGGGRRQEVEIDKPWRYQPGIDTLYRHIAATYLGQKGGLSNASKFKR